MHLPKKQVRADVAQVLKGRPQLHDLLQVVRVAARLLKIHDCDLADLHRRIVQLRDKELQHPIRQVRGLVQQPAEVVRRK